MKNIQIGADAPQEGYAPIIHKACFILLLLALLATALLWLGRQPLLERGVQQQQLFLTKTALLFGADPNTVFTTDNSKPITPLLQAIDLADIPLMRVLLSHGANPNASHPRYPLFSCLQQDIRSTEIICSAVLLESGASPNIRHPSSKDSPLHRVVQADNVDLTQLLLAYKADANLRDGKDKMPLLYASNQAMIDVVLPKTDVSATDHFGNTVLLQAIAENADTTLIKSIYKANPALIGQTNSQERTALHHAAKHNNAAVVTWALTLDSIDVNAVDIYDKPALLYATDSLTAYTLAAHTDIGMQDSEGNTVLMSAIGNAAGWAAVGASLYFGGKFINSPNKAGFTPLMKAIGKSDERLVMKLINKGASVSIV